MSKESIALLVFSAPLFCENFGIPHAAGVAANYISGINSLVTEGAPWQGRGFGNGHYQYDAAHSFLPK
jgi:hypothetical protein